MISYTNRSSRRGVADHYDGGDRYAGADCPIRYVAAGGGGLEADLELIATPSAFK